MNEPWSDSIKRCELVPDDWGGPAPAQVAIVNATGFLQQCDATIANGLPQRIKPSMVGGVGITFRNQWRRTYVEFYNTGEVYALFSDGVSEPSVRSIIPTADHYTQLLIEIYNWLPVYLRDTNVVGDQMDLGP